MQVLVTGGAGYIGSITCHQLIKRGYKVIIIDSLEYGHKKSIPKKAKFYKVNLSNIKKLDKIFSKHKIDAVMHFASYIQVGESMKDPLKYYKNNVSNSLNLVKVMLKHKVFKIVFSSTAAVYGNPKKIPIKENSELKPTNNYGHSKLMFEKILDSCAPLGLQSICLRYFNAAGAAFGIGEDHNPETHLIPLVLKTALKQRKEIKIFGKNYPTKDKTCIRDYIHILDLTDAHILALKTMNKNKKFNLGSSNGFSIKEVIEMSKKITQKNIPTKYAPRREGDPAVLVADNKKAKKELGWKPKYGLKEIIQSAWEWHKNNPKGFKN